jgi:activator of HSP90 ATPase
MEPDYASLTWIADTCHASRGTTKRRLAEAGITPNAEGRYAKSEALAAMRAGTDGARQLGHAAAGRGPTAAKTSPAPSTTDTAATQADVDTAAFKQARTAVEVARARRLQLEADRLANNLLDRADVSRAAQAFGGHLRAAFLGLPNAVAPKLVGLDDQDAIAAIVEASIYDVLAQAADGESYIVERLLE